MSAPPGLQSNVSSQALPVEPPGRSPSEAFKRAAFLSAATLQFPRRLQLRGVAAAAVRGLTAIAIAFSTSHVTLDLPRWTMSGTAPSEPGIASIRLTTCCLVALLVAWAVWMKLAKPRLASDELLSGAPPLHTFGPIDRSVFDVRDRMFLVHAWIAVGALSLLTVDVLQQAYARLLSGTSMEYAALPLAALCVAACAVPMLIKAGHFVRHAGDIRIDGRATDGAVLSLVLERGASALLATLGLLVAACVFAFGLGASGVDAFEQAFGAPLSRVLLAIPLTCAAASMPLAAFVTGLATKQGASARAIWIVVPKPADAAFVHGLPRVLDSLIAERRHAPIVVLLDASIDLGGEHLHLAIARGRGRMLFPRRASDLDDWSLMIPPPDRWPSLPVRELHVPALLLLSALERLGSDADQVVLVARDAEASWLDWCERTGRRFSAVAEPLGTFVFDRTPSSTGEPKSSSERRLELSPVRALIVLAAMLLLIFCVVGLLWPQRVEHLGPSPTSVDLLRIAPPSLPAPTESDLQQLIAQLGSDDTQTRRLARTELAMAYAYATRRVVRVLIEAIQPAGPTSYRTNLGVLVVLGEVEGGWYGSAADLAKVEALAKDPDASNEVFREALEAARRNYRSGESAL